MKLTQKISIIIMGCMLQCVALAHEGLHTVGQVHAGENHIGLFEIALALIATVLLVAYQLKKHKSKK